MLFMVHGPHNMVQTLSILSQQERPFSFIGSTGRKLGRERRASEMVAFSTVRECVEYS